MQVQSDDPVPGSSSGKTGSPLTDGQPPASTGRKSQDSFIAPANFKRRELIDRLAAVAVKIGGLGIIGSILAILLFITWEVLPLSSPAHVESRLEIPIPPEAAGFLLADEYNTHMALLGVDGVIRVYDSATSKLTAEHRIEIAPIELPPPDPSVKDAPPLPQLPAEVKITGTFQIPGTEDYLLATNDGRLVIQPLEWDVRFEESTRVVEAHFGDPIVLMMDEQFRPLQAFTAFHHKGDGLTTAAAQLADGTISIVRRTVEENAMGGEGEETIDMFTAESPYRLTAMIMDVEQRNLYAGTAEGQIVYWRLADGQPGQAQVSSAGPAGITAMTMLIGGRSVVVGQSNGDVSVWFKVRAGENEENFIVTRIRDFPKHPGPIRLISPSRRDRGFFVLDETGKLSLHFSTSERTLWEGRSTLDAPTAIYFSPKADAVYLAQPGKLASYKVENPHPDISMKALFGKVWYEGYPGPSHTWQSTGGTDDFESKLSLVPLIVGTLKGTFYSLILAIPLAVFGAMFASQFMHPSLKGYVKPVVETMASLPSVVLGFIGGLWLAPLLQEIFPGFIAMFIVLPALIVAASRIWMSLPRATRNRYPAGVEALLLTAVLAGGIYLCIQMSPLLEKIFFGGSFELWVSDALGLRYDQRNAVVVGLAMGFAVIPIIFAISEDAFSNVPRHLTSASLALGASRWQTVTQIVLPTASPGIFSAIMIGFGRAVGETMIVLMATGNTPIMDWDLFNGFRTLSANIAVEIPEAPVHGTLYRTLFLAALILFTLTFVVNTLAELVRHRLRQKYAKL